MSGPITAEQITEHVFECVCFETGTSEELWPERIAEIANGLINAGIVSPPKPELLEALECLESWVIQHGCKCGHPACGVCQETIIAERVIARAKGGAE